MEHGRAAIALLDGVGSAVPGMQPVLAIASQAVAGGLAALGQVPDATAAYAEAIALLRQMDHADVRVVTIYAQCLLSLAELQLALGDPAGALRNAVEGQEITAPEATTELWPPVLQLLHGAALVLQSQSRFLLGEPAVDPAVDALRTLAPVPDLDPVRGSLMATAYGVQAADLARRGQTFEAIEPALAAVTAYRPFLEDPSIRLRSASTGGLAGACLLENDRVEEAYPLLAEAADLFGSLPEVPLPVVHEYATTLANLARCLLADGATREALDAFAAAVDLLETVPAEQDGVLDARALTAFGIAQVLGEEGLLAEAASFLQQAVAAHVQLGQPYPDLAAAMDDLGWHLRARLGTG